MTTPGEYQYQRAPLPFQPAGYPPAEPPSPQPQTPPKVDPTFAWTLAFAPLLIAALPLVWSTISDSTSLFIAYGLNVGLVFADRARLRAAGVQVSFWWVLLVPGYLIVRTMRAKSTPAIPVVWFVTFLASLALPTLVPAAAGPVTMDSRLVEQQLEQSIRQQEGFAVTVSCPSNPQVPVGGNFSRDVTAPADGSRGHVYVAVTDSDGRYTWVITQ